MDSSSAFCRTRKDKLPAHQLRTLAHRYQSDPALVRTLREPNTMIFYFQFKRIRQEAQTHPRRFGARVPRHIVQRFLHYAVDVHTCAAIHGERYTLLLIGYGNPRLSFYGRDIPVERALKPGLVQHHRMQRLREAADLLQCGLHDLENFLQVRSEGRSLRRVSARATEHRADGSEDLSKLIVQFAGNIAQRGFLGSNKL